MAPLLDQPMESFEYTHKKFNCGYFHKKLGKRFIRRASQEDVDRQQVQGNLKKANIFRPYDLQPARKQSLQDTKIVPPTTQTSSTATESFLSFYVLQKTAEQSQEEYNLKLQRQRAALYIKHVMQFYENGYGWPTLHPNAINNAAFYRQL